MKLYWTIITEQQPEKEMAIFLAELLTDRLKGSRITSFEKYYKFDRSWKIQITQELINKDAESCIIETLKQIEKICMPWDSIKFSSSYGLELELMFNKKPSSRFVDLRLNVITWMHVFLAET